MFFVFVRGLIKSERSPKGKKLALVIDYFITL